jgi:hypothetical protein
VLYRLVRKETAVALALNVFLLIHLVTNAQYITTEKYVLHLSTYFFPLEPMTMYLDVTTACFSFFRAAIISVTSVRDCV